jgi:hypothetical protein
MKMALRYPILMFVHLLSWHVLAETNAPAPRLLCDEAKFDFGVRDESDVVTHPFVLKNAGDAALQIVKVKSSCGCTVASLSTNTVAPGAEAKVEARFTLRGRRGEQYKLITVDSNDPEHPRFLLSLRGTVTTELGMAPAYLNLGAIDDKDPVSRDAHLVGQTNEAEIVSVETKSTEFKVEVVPDSQGRKHRIRVTTLPPLAQGYIRGTINIKTTHPKRPTLQLSVGGSVAGDVQVVPRSLMIKGTPGQRVSRSIYLRYKKAKAPEVLALELPLDTMRARVQKPGAQMQRIDIYDIPVDKELNGASIRIRLKDAATLHVPIRVQTI